MPDEDKYQLADIRAAHERVSEFLRALDEVEENAPESPGAAPLPFE